MTGCFEYFVVIGASTVLAIILKQLKCKYYDNGLTVVMIVDVTRKVSHLHSNRFIICKE